MGYVSENAEDAATDRPWPAPGPDATWWRSEPAESTATPAAESTTATTAESDAATAEAELGPRPIRTSPFATPPVIRRTRKNPSPDKAAAAKTTESTRSGSAPAEPVTVPHPTEDPTTDRPTEDPLVQQALADEALAAEFESAPAQATVDGRPSVVPAAVPGQRQPEKATRPPRARPARPPRPPRNPMRPWLAMPALVLLALATSFFAWVSAEPFWLAVGHGARGVATILPTETTTVDPADPADPADLGWRTRACRATFIAEGGAFIVSRVVLAGVTGPACTAGTRLPAQMVSADGERAYPIERGDLTLRWSVGLLLIVLCGLGIMLVTGALRFAGWRRVTTTALSLGAPLLVTFGILAATF